MKKTSKREITELWNRGVVGRVKIVFSARTSYFAVVLIDMHDLRAKNQQTTARTF